MKVFRQTYKVGEVLRAKEKTEEFRDDPTKSVSSIKLNFKGHWLLTIEYEDLG